MTTAPGDPTEINLNEEIQKAEQGDVAAMIAVTNFLEAAEYIGEDADPEINERYMSYLTQIAESGESSYYIYLADAYVRGEVAPYDIEKAISMYEQAAAHGVPFGNECIGKLYFEGVEVEQDFAKAYEYFTKDQGDKAFITEYYLGEMFRLGLHVPKDQRKACRHYAKVARSKFKWASADDYFWRCAYRLGCALHRGVGVKKDLEEALQLIEIAREQGDTEDEFIEGEGITEQAIDQEWHALKSELGRS
ncbi:MAG: sel1 repeat family protein [Succinivibrio sp.]|nr:sel1 repeat family protein [Succinivibrio sp.]